MNTIHSSEIYAEKVGTLEKPVQSVVSDLIGVKEIGVETKMVAKLIEVDEIASGGIVTDEIESDLITAAEIKVIEGAVVIESKNIIAENVTADNFNGVATKSSGINYISNTEPSNPKEGDFWLDTSSLLNPVLKIRYGLQWKTVANL